MTDYRDHDYTQAECLANASERDGWAEHHDNLAKTDPAFAEFAKRDRRRAEDWRSRAAWAKDAK